MTDNNQKNSLLSGIKDSLGVIIIVGLCLYALMANAGGARTSLPMSFGLGGAIVTTGSMEPNLPVDSYILVKAEKSYAKGDIVAYTSGNLVIVHRITKIDGDMITTKGDANNVEDPPFPVELIKGKVIWQIPHVGIAIRLLKTPLGGMILILIAFLYLMYLQKGKEEKSLPEKQPPTGDQTKGE